jgi:phosphoglycerate dehydrogenase-like enzyme
MMADISTPTAPAREEQAEPGVRHERPSASATVARPRGVAVGPGHEPAAIALTPILSARYREADLNRIRAAAPGARLVSVSLEGLADGSLDDVEVLLRGPMPAATFDRLLARCPDLRWVHSATAGVERVLTPTAARRHLLITNARGVFSQPIAEYVLMMILAAVRRLPQLLELQRERTWQPLQAREMRDVTVGIVGLGSIGRAVAELALAFGSRVIATRREALEAGAEGAADPRPPAIDRILGHDQLDELLGESDFVVLALPLTASTDRLMDAARLGRMRPGAWLINVARGRLVDERALMRTLREGRLGGAVLDTLLEEPLPPGSPLWSTPGLIITPHTSWSSGRVLDRSIELFCENLARFRSGHELLNAVDPTLGY